VALFIRILFGIFVFFFLVLMVMGYSLSKRILAPKRQGIAEGLQLEVQKGSISERTFETIPKKEVYITSPFGYRLHGFFVPKLDSTKVMILNHGITLSFASCLKYVDFYRSLGFHVLLHDFRGHGLSGGGHITYGQKEKEDMRTWVGWLFQEIPGLKTVGVHGESMGSAVAIEHGYIDPRVDFIISDCAYSDLTEILHYRMAWDLGMSIFPVIYFVEFWLMVREGLYLSHVRPKQRVEEMEIPIFFIHGAADKYTPPRMSEELFQRKKGARKLWLSPMARHSGSFLQDRETYEKKIREFLLEIGVL